MNSYSILVTGANGQVGRALQEAAASYPHLIFHFYDREGLDITKQEGIAKVLAHTKPDMVINTAAYTAVDKAEEESEEAYLINEKAVELLARQCKDSGISLLHLSTDYVYHNGLTRPLREDDPVNPVGIYAKTKLAGEHAAQAILPDTYIIRTSWVYGVYGHNFVKTMLKLGNSGRAIKVVNDQKGSPTNAHDLSQLIIKLAPKMIEGRIPSGIYNYCNAGETSWYGLARKIFEKCKMSADIEGIPTKEYPTAAERPAYSVLSTKKVNEFLDTEIPSWEESLAKYLPRIAQQLNADQ